ncbi:MAG: DMT family transporter [Cardiobacteriaceae bacterium]|nr:DMT family transporter [Cardiobacteriaceae bacterium]
MNAARGLAMTLVTVLMWASLPLAMKQVLRVLDPQSVVAVRFVVATLVLGWFLRRRGRLPDWRALLHGKRRWLFVIGALGLAGNFYLFSKALIYLTPEASQVLAQLSPFILLFAGAVFFHEKLGAHQWWGALVLFAGLLLFFNRELPHLFAGENTALLGIVLSISASLVWVSYGLVQKVLLRDFSAPQVLFVLYGGSALLTLPFAHWAMFAGLDGYQWLCLAYCCINTPIAYGAFAEALACWDVSKVSATITMVPLFTMVFTEAAFWLWPGVFAEPDLNGLAYAGAAMVVAGALCSVLGGAVRKR